jgi:hypothetical protein
MTLCEFWDKHKSGITKAVIALIVVVVIILLIVGGVLLFKHFWPSSGAFAGFASKYRGLDPYMNVDPLVKFYYANRELRTKFEMGTIIIDEVYYIYKQFINSPSIENVPVSVMSEAAKTVQFMESGREFYSPESVDFKPLGLAIVNMDRMLTSYLDSLKYSKNKVGGTDSQQEKLYSDYLKVGNTGSGYIDGVLNGVELESFYGNDTGRAQAAKEDLVEQIGLQLQLTQADPVRYMQNEHAYENKLSESMHGGKMQSAAEKYVDKRFPGTFERRQISDEPSFKYEKDPKDPNVPRLGIIGKVPDVPYHYDVHAKNYVRSF